MIQAPLSDFRMGDNHRTTQLNQYLACKEGRTLNGVVENQQSNDIFDVNDDS